MITKRNLTLLTLAAFFSLSCSCASIDADRQVHDVSLNVPSDMVIEVGSADIPPAPVSPYNESTDAVYFPFVEESVPFEDMPSANSHYIPPAPVYDPEKEDIIRTFPSSQIQDKQKHIIEDDETERIETKRVDPELYEEFSSEREEHLPLIEFE